MKNPYPEYKKNEGIPGRGGLHWIKIKDERHTCWQEGYEAKEKEDQELYEVLKTALGTILALDNGKSWLNEIYPTINKAIAKWEDNKAEANAQLIAESPRMAELIKRMVEGGDSQSIAMEAREIVKTLGLKVEK